MVANTMGRRLNNSELVDVGALLCSGPTRRPRQGYGDEVQMR